MKAKITIEDDTGCVVLSIEEARELYLELKDLFGLEEESRPFDNMPKWGDSSKLWPGNIISDDNTIPCGTGTVTPNGDK